MLGTMNLSTVSILNRESPSFGDLATVKRKVIAVAYCTSRACAGVKSRVMIELTTDRDTCPDCGHYIVFVKKVDRR